MKIVLLTLGLFACSSNDPPDQGRALGGNPGVSGASGAGATASGSGGRLGGGSGGGVASGGTAGRAASGGISGGGVTSGGVAGGGAAATAAGGVSSAAGGASNQAGAGSGAGAGGTGGQSVGGGSGRPGTGGYSNGGMPAGGSAGGAGASAGASNTVDATTMAKAMGFGANIGNTLENTTAWETGWGQPLITQAYLSGMASRGVKTVRVPVAWNTYAVNGVIDATKMNRVKEVVSWISAAHMYAIVNIHWDGGWIDNDTDGNPNRNALTDDVKTKFASYWTQIATAFGSVGNDLIFEALNEESKFYVNGDSTKPDYAALNTLNQLFVTTVRAQGGFNATRALLIAGMVTDIALTCVDAFTVPSDPAGGGKLFLSVHYYTPYTFCGLDTVESWGSPRTTWGTDADKKELTDLFTQLATFSAARHIPVILGEFGVTLGQSYPREQASRTAWMQAVAKASFDHGIVPVLWDTGSDISRTDGSFSPALQAALENLH